MTIEIGYYSDDTCQTLKDIPGLPSNPVPIGNNVCTKSLEM